MIYQLDIVVSLIGYIDLYFIRPKVLTFQTCLVYDKVLRRSFCIIFNLPFDTIIFSQSLNTVNFNLSRVTVLIVRQFTRHLEISRCCIETLFWRCMVRSLCGCVYVRASSKFDRLFGLDRQFSNIGSLFLFVRG